MKSLIRFVGVERMNSGTPSTRMGAASPMARLMAKMPPVMIMGIDAGSVIFQVVCHCVAPSASEAVRKLPGTVRNAYWLETMTIGNTTSINVSPPASTPWPNGSCR